MASEKINFPEKFLYHIWDAQHIKYDDYQNKQLSSVSGKSIKIHFTGHYNTMNGADFKNASLEINGVHHNGEIEIHLNSSDWYHHSHDINPAFNSVILHVVYEHNHHNDMTINENNDQIEILEIKKLFTDEIEVLFKEYSERNFRQQEKYCQLFSQIRPEFFEKFLFGNGMERLNKKVNRFTAELSFVSMDQLFYQSIFEAMGYSKNKNQFYLFSKNNPWLYYKNLYTSPKGLSFKEFVESLVNNAGFDSKKYDWYLFRIRPCNQPITRLYQIAPFIYSSFSTSLVTEIQKLFSFKKDDFDLKKFKKHVYEKFCVENTFTKYHLGKERINTVIINIFIPILIVYSIANQENQLKSFCETIFTEFESLEENHIDQLMKNYMTEAQYTTSQKKAVFQQGLLNIYYKYCINHLCEICK